MSMISPAPSRSLRRADDANPVPPRQRTAALIAILGALTAVAPLGIDTCVPGFPSMRTSLHTSSSAIQLTMTAFLIGLVVGQLIIGPISDGLGRRRLLISGVAGFALCSLGCALAPSIGVLTAARFLQGIAGAAGVVLARAVITDRFQGADVPRYFALLSQIIGVAPAVAPVFGGAIVSVSTWRAVFVTLTVIGVALLLAVIARVPESLPPERRRGGDLAGTFRAMGVLLTDRPFLGYTLVLGFASAALFAYISGSSFVFEGIHGASPATYSLVFAVNALGMLLAGTVFAKLARRVRLNALLTAGTAVSALGALAQLLLVTTIGESFAGTWITLFVIVSGIGMIFPAAMSLGLTLGRSAPGAASAVMGGLQFLVGAVASPLSGLFGQTSSAPMAGVILAALALALLALFGLVHPWQGRGEVSTHP